MKGVRQSVWKEAWDSLKTSQRVAHFVFLLYQPAAQPFPVVPAWGLLSPDLGYSSVGRRLLHC